MSRAPAAVGPTMSYLVVVTRALGSFFRIWLAAEFKPFHQFANLVSTPRGRGGANMASEASMTDNEKQYLDRGKRGQEALEPVDAQNEAWIPTPFAGEEVDPNQDQTMSELDEALQAATGGEQSMEVDDPYDGESDAPGEPS